MIKENKKAIILCALILLIPVIAGTLLWPKLPDQIPTHWNADGETDQYSGKAFAVYGLNGILIACYGLCIFGTASDPKKKNISRKTFVLCISAVPLCSLFANGMTLSTALGKEPDVPFWGHILISVILIIIGNFLPKMRQSYTVGIKLPWTLASEDNWNKTHRFSGRIWVAAGLIFLANAFLGYLPFPAECALFILIILIPVIYSYLYSRKENQ